jgi:uncharacterized membrane protein
MTRLVFEHSAVWMIGLPVALGLTLAAAWSQWRQARPKKQLALLAVLRGAVLTALVLLAARPVYVDQEKEGRKSNQVVLLVDRSESMSLKEGGRSRYREAVDFLRDRLLPALKSARVQVQPLLFAEDVAAADGKQIAYATPNGPRTDLGRAILRGTAQNALPPLAVIALTDGVATENGDNARAMAALAENRVPLVGVGFGRETGPRALSLEDVVGPPRASRGQEFLIATRLKVSGEQELPAFDLVLCREGKFLQKKTVTPGAGARVWQESFAVTEPEERLCQYTVQLVPPADPTIKCPRTTGAAAVRIENEKELRVLFVQGGLTWDYKFISLALAADRTVRLSGLTRVARGGAFQGIGSGADNASGTGADKVAGTLRVPVLQEFPSTIDKLAAFRVVILSNLRPTDLVPKQQELLAQFCGQFGGGLLMIGGADTFNVSWQGSRLEQLLPVQFASAPRGLAQANFRLTITSAALNHRVFKISDEGNPGDAWSALPTFTNYAAIETVKPGAEVWAVQSGTSQGNKELPVIVSQRYGAGLSAVICVQNFWRWRLAKDGNTRHFDRFWQQFLRYLAEEGASPVTLSVPDQPLRPGGDVRVVLGRRADPTSAAAAGATYRFVVADADGRKLTSQAAELKPGGSAEVTFRAEKPGLFTMSVVDAHDNAVFSRSLELSDIAIEFTHTARSMETLRQWAGVSDGMAVRCEDCGDVGPLIDRIKRRTQEPERDRSTRLPAGINAAVLVLLVGCLSGEWLLRRSWQMG